ncbi:MAG: response regulator, partial [Candidatus Nanopelagicaceae bacterium]
MIHTTQNTHKSLASDSQIIEILLVDDQKFVSHKLEQILSSRVDLKIVGTASDEKEAIALVESLKPDVVLLDIEMPKMNGIEATSIINRRFPECKILVFSTHKSPQYVRQMILAGADGYILKTTPDEDLVTAIHSVCRGYSYFSPQLLKKVLLTENAPNFSLMKPVKQAKIESSILPATQKKYRFGVKLLTWSGFLAAIAVGSWFGYSYYRRQSIEAIPINLVPVAKGNIEITVSESGEMELGRQQTLKSPGENATVEQVKVSEGDKVSVGQTLLILRDRDAQEQEQDQELENDKFVLTQARNEEKVVEAQQKVKKKQGKVREAEELFRDGYISEFELDEDREELDTAQAELGDAQLELNSAKLDIQNGREKLANIQQKLQDRLVTSAIDGVVLDVATSSTCPLVVVPSGRAVRSHRTRTCGGYWSTGPGH